VQYLEVLGQCVAEDDDEKDEQCNCEKRNQPIRFLADIAFTFPHQPASTEQGISETQADTAQHRKGTEPAEIAAGVLAVGNRKLLHEGAYNHALDESSDKGTSGKAGIPDPAQPFRLVTVFERDAAQDQPRQPQQDRQIKRRQ
jgi:hypothetical protein